MRFNHKFIPILCITLFSLIAEQAIFADSIYRRTDSVMAIPAQSPVLINPDLLIVRRLTDSYRTVAAQNENRGDSMWQLFFDQRHKEIHKIFINGRFEEVADILTNPASTDLFYGFDNLTLSLLPGFASVSAQQGYALMCLDSLLLFAEAIGAAPLDNPESYHFLAPTPWHADLIVQKINQTLNKQILFPNPYPHEHGAWSSYGIISYRAPQALYQAYRIQQLLKGIENPRVLEIGAGLGRTAYYSRLLGIKDYTIVDLPFTAMSSGYFLGVTLGGDQILYPGENSPDAQTRLKIRSPQEFLASAETYDLIINVDGLTEMDPSVARDYWKKIEKSSPMFLSINHEANPLKVKTLIDESKNVASVERHLYWMRRGYAEELIRFR